MLREEETRRHDFVGQREQLWCVWWGREKRWEDRDQIPAECEERLSDGQN